MSATAVSEHYEKRHFSDWAANKDVMQRMPKAFLSTSPKPQDPLAMAAPKPVVEDPEVVSNREANKAGIMARLAKFHAQSPYHGPEQFECPCCLRKLTEGRLVVCTRERFILCTDCYNETRVAIPRKTHKV